MINNFLLSIAFLIAYIVIEIFLFKLLFEWLPRLWNYLFGTHQVVVADFEYDIIETRRNFNNKLINRYFLPNFSLLLLKANKSIKEGEND